MDLNFFELEDDIFLSSVDISLSDSTSTRSTLPFFSCNNTNYKSTEISSEGFVKNFYISSPCDEAMFNSVKLTQYNFKSESFYNEHIANYLFSNTRMQIQMLASGIENTENFSGQSCYEKRMQITYLYHVLRSIPKTHFSPSLLKGIHSLRVLINRLSTSLSMKCNLSFNDAPKNYKTNPSYQLSHGMLEWFILDLIILQEMEDSSLNHVFIDCVTYQRQYIFVLQHLMALSVSVFAKTNSNDLWKTSPFDCICIRECWLIIQLLSEKSEDKLEFWNCFNIIIDQIKNQPESLSLNSKNWFEFIFWMMRSIVEVQGYRDNGIFEGNRSIRVIENFSLLRNILESFLITNPPEEQLRVCLSLIKDILLEWWSPNGNIPTTLWEYFYKKLNTPFIIFGSSPCNLAVSSSSGKGYLDRIRHLLDQNSIEINQTSFNIFLFLLGKMIERYRRIDQNNQIQKILGRILSKFSAAKFMTLSELGIHNTIELFLTIAVSGNNKDITTKLKDKLISIPIEKLSMNLQVSVLKGHLALLLLLFTKVTDNEKLIEDLFKQVNNIKSNPSIIKIMTECLREVIEMMETLDRGVHILIDTWIPTHLNTCKSLDQERLLETLHITCKKLLNYNSLTTLIHDDVKELNLAKSLIKHVFPFVKQNFATSLSSWIPLLAADLCIITSIFIDGNQFLKHLKSFLEDNPINKIALIKFLKEILLSNQGKMVDDSYVFRIWFRSMITLSSNNEDVKKLTHIITTLKDFKTVCDLNVHEFLNVKEPLSLFITSVAKSCNKNQNYTEKCSIINKFNTYLISFENWISDINEIDEITMRFYSFIAIVIYNCADIVYIRSKVSCFFHIALTRFIIPHNVQMGKPVETKLAQVVHKVWPFIVQGIGKLNFKTDSYITKTLTDLILKWTPNFRIANNTKTVAKPFITCISDENEQLSFFIFEKLAKTFLTTQKRQADQNSCLVITIFQEVFETVENEFSKFKLLLQAICLTMLEHLIMVDEIVPSRKMLFILINKIFNTKIFTENNDIKNVFVNNIKIITKKYLSVATYFYFELLTKLTEINYEIVECIFEFLDNEIKLLEQRQKLGDRNLRILYDKLNAVIIKEKNKKNYV